VLGYQTLSFVRRKSERKKRDKGGRGGVADLLGEIVITIRMKNDRRSRGKGVVGGVKEESGRKSSAKLVVGGRLILAEPGDVGEYPVRRGGWVVRFATGRSRRCGDNL